MPNGKWRITKKPWFKNRGNIPLGKRIYKSATNVWGGSELILNSEKNRI